MAFASLYGHYQEIRTCNLINTTAIFSTTFTPFEKSTSKHLYCRNQTYQGTTYSYCKVLRRYSIRGSQYAPSGRPSKCKASGDDCHTQTKRGKQDHTKRKHSHSLNVKLNQPNPFQHWQGHWRIQSKCLDSLSWCTQLVLNLFFIAVSGIHTECKLVGVVIKQYTSHNNTATKIFLSSLKKCYVRHKGWFKTVCIFCIQWCSASAFIEIAHTLALLTDSHFVNGCYLVL